MAPVSYRQIHIAWTHDDGPTVATPRMDAAMGGRPATWFIMRSRLTSTGLIEDLKARVERGDEVGIHCSHPSESHVAWFPVKVASAVPKAYGSMDELFDHLVSFTSWLREQGLPPKFVRLPGGEVSEVMAYLAAKGVPKVNRRPLAGRILRQEDVSAEAPGVQAVARDYNALRAKLDELRLRVWGGTAAGPMLRSQSWEAESSGGTLTNDATRKLRGLVDAFGSVKRQRSLIILAHDTTHANAEQVERDIAEDEGYAADQEVLLHYHTLSGLFLKVRGFAP